MRGKVPSPSTGIQAMMAKMKAGYQNAARDQALNASQSTPSPYHSPLHHAPPPPPMQPQTSPPQYAPRPFIQPQSYVVPQPV